MDAVLEKNVLQDVAEFRTNPGFNELNAFYLNQHLQFDRYGNPIFLDEEEMDQIVALDQQMEFVIHKPGGFALVRG